MKESFRDSLASDRPDVTQKVGALIPQAAEVYFKKAPFWNLTLNYRVWLLKWRKNCNNAPFQFELQPFNRRYLLYSDRVQEGLGVHVEAAWYLTVWSAVVRIYTNCLNTDTLVHFHTMYIHFTALIININYFPKEHNPLHAELNPICHLLALLGTHPILHISRIRVNQ